MVNKEVIRKRLNKLDEYLAVLGGCRSTRVKSSWRIQSVMGAPSASFFADQCNVPAAESRIRIAWKRCWISAGTFWRRASQSVSQSTRRSPTASDADLLRLLAGYRNRLVHFYHKVADEELFDLCSQRLWAFTWFL